ncbi:uncharacterized protein LOC111989163 [Quercus suber]|uniref:uncharacterized protein LOC111989163 n=1 Tax=Quercus suber TaxID=58331 RepID=UPI000CE1B567|nr:salivary glue protein Sgs-3-like [Quercus suber]XP_023878514.1 salivary glue protein Sgs-3-like [Quercus suber]POE78233.1 hypothetical protein CFP56_78009 [Quercus suber]POE80771.1 hypothetical protein CFP56_70922 [Quercus suber]
MATPTASQATTAPKAPPITQLSTKAPTITQPTAKASKTTQLIAKAFTTTQPANVGTTKVTLEPSKAPNEKEVSKEKEVKHSEPPPVAKTDPSPSTSS